MVLLQRQRLATLLFRQLDPVLLPQQRLRTLLFLFQRLAQLTQQRWQLQAVQVLLYLQRPVRLLRTQQQPLLASELFRPLVPPSQGQ
jgi:hypothetical protein